MDSVAKPFVEGKRPAQVPLRVGVLLDRERDLENWQLRIIDRILEDSRFSLSAVLVYPFSAECAHTPTVLRVAAWLERKTIARQPIYQPKHFSLPDLPFEQASLITETGHRDSLKLDLMLCLSPGTLPETALARLRFGEWRFSFLQNVSGGADWFGYAGVIEEVPATQMRIEIRQAGIAHACDLATAAFNTKFSAIRNADFIKERAVTLVMRELRRVADTRQLGAIHASQTTATTSEPPTVRQLYSYGASLVRKLFARGAQAAQMKIGGGADVWGLYVGKGYPEDFDPHKAVLIEPDEHEIRADPFLIEHEGQLFLFYEAYAPSDTKAHIAVSRLVGNRLERLGIALECDHHLSYPFIFRHDDQLFMIPEAHQARRLEVWRCVDFPLGWELYSTGLEGFAPADSALTHFDGKWWLFTNLSDFHAYEDHCSELHVFEVDGPELKRIVPHKNNPVVIDSTVARNGGRPFEHEGKLYRPSQRNEHGIYGYALNIMEVEHLDLETYRERCVRTITPDFGPGQVACHHLDAAAGRFVIDVMFEG